jgi:hypothetical protein
METFGWARTAVVYAEGDRYAPFYREALEHAGLHFETLESVSGRELSRFNVLVLCGYGTLGSNALTVVQDWVKRGGCVVCTGSTWNLETILGLDHHQRHVSNALLVPSKTDRLWPASCDRARFFGGVLVKPHNSEVIAKVGHEYAGVTRKKAGKGLALFLAAHVGQSMSLMQLGRSVECDAIGPSDGSAILDNGTLRAEDGTVLDYRDDRATTSGSDIPFFAYAHCDVLRDVLVRAVLNAVDHKGLSTPVLWHWPNGSSAAAMLTLDCQSDEKEPVNNLHRMLMMYGVPAAWMVGTPGYSVDVYRAMRSWDHEVGLLFHTEDRTGWNEERLKIQYKAVSRLAAQPMLHSTRAEDGKWKGWTAYYGMCEAAGARVSISKGGRQPGTSGFLFGTCHPFFPTRVDGTSYFALEIPYSVFRPGVSTPNSAAAELLARTASVHGCFQIVSHPECVRDAAEADSLRRLLSLCKQNRLEFMLPQDVYAFEHGRRKLRVAQKTFDREGTLLLTSETELQGLTILFSGQRVAVEMAGRELPVQHVERYGTAFTMVRINLESKQQIELRIAAEALAPAA